MAIGTLTAIFAGLSIGGAILNAFGQKRAADEGKKLAEFNAKVAEQQAREALALGKEEAERFRLSVRGLIGSQRAGFAGQNVDIGIGSPVDVVADAAFLGELDALTITTNAARQAWGFRVQAENFRRGGTNLQTAAKFSMASTLLGTGATLLAARYGGG